MKRLQYFSLWGSLGTLCLVLSPSCDDDSANNDGDGGDGGETTGSGGATGGSDSGGSGGATGGTSAAGSAGLGAGPSVPDCDADEWLEPGDETCESCVPYESLVHVCEDFVDDDPGMGGATSTGTAWDDDTKTLTLELRSPLPPPTSASVTFYYNYDGGGGETVSADMEIDGRTLTATFDVDPGLNYISSLELTLIDACGTENEVSDAAGTSVIWAYDSGNDGIYEFYCE